MHVNYTKYLKQKTVRVKQFLSGLCSLHMFAGDSTVLDKIFRFTRCVQIPVMNDWTKFAASSSTATAAVIDKEIQRDKERADILKNDHYIKTNYQIAHILLFV